MMLRHVKYLKWMSALLTLGIFFTRFAYGAGNEIDEKGELQLTSLGIILTVGTVVFFLLTILLFLVDKKD